VGQTQYETGRAALSYTGKVAPAAVRDQASQMAETKAIETYYAEAGESALSNFDSRREQILGNLDRYVLDAVVVNEEDHRDSRLYTVTIRVKLNLAALNNTLTQSSTVANSAKSAKSRLVLLFVARQASDATSYDARVYQRVETNRTANGSDSVAQHSAEGETITKNQVSTNATKTVVGASTSTSSLAVERGGSSSRKATETTWRLFPISSLNSVFSSFFGNAGFRITDAADVEPQSGGRLQVAMVQEDYKTGFDLKSTTLANIEAGLKIAGVPYLGLGTLDVGFANVDAATGLLRVAVTVNAKILDLNEAIPETVAAVGPVQYAGLGPTEAEAQTNALTMAAQRACHDLISQLTNAGIH
jgi:hypothetical protein